MPYHDTVYNTRKNDNEEQSAELAEKRLSGAGLKSPFIDKVISLIMITKHQIAPEELDQQYLIDIDLSILGKSQREFEEYEKNIREEYSWVPEEQFRAGRQVVLQRFLERDSIYSTDFFRKKYENQAIRNIENSLASRR